MRNQDIIKNYRREINLQTKSIRDKTVYTRKTKHKIKY